MFGIAALGIVHGAVESRFGEVARIAGGLAFGVVFLVVGRAELFNDNFFDPVAAAVDRSDSWLVSLLRLWAVTFALNLVGGILFALVFSIEGMLPPGAPEASNVVAEEIVRRRAIAGFASAIVGGALVTLLSFLLQAVNTIGSRITIGYIVGFLLAIGPFDHVIVAALHVVSGMLFGANVGVAGLVETIIVATAGNFVGGLGLVTLTHVARALGARGSDE